VGFNCEHSESILSLRGRGAFVTSTSLFAASLPLLRFHFFPYDLGKKEAAEWYFLGIAKELELT